VSVCLDDRGDERRVLLWVGRVGPRSGSGEGYGISGRAGLNDGEAGGGDVTPLADGGGNSQEVGRVRFVRDALGGDLT
jgi:hypothetical protein